MKSRMEKIERINKMRINKMQVINLLKNKEEINTVHYSSLLLELSEHYKIADFGNINKAIFKVSNEVTKVKKVNKIDSLSYNIGTLEALLTFYNLIEAKAKEYSFLNEYNKLNEKQRQIINLIYEKDGISSKTIRDKLNIKPQYFYNLTHDSKMEKLIYVYGDKAEKNKYFVLTPIFRSYFEENICPVKYYKKDFNFIKFKSLEKDKEESYGLSKINKQLNYE